MKLNKYAVVIFKLPRYCKMQSLPTIDDVDPPVYCILKYSVYILYIKNSKIYVFYKPFYLAIYVYLSYTTLFIVFFIFSRK